MEVDFNFRECVDYMDTSLSGITGNLGWGRCDSQI